MDPLIFPRGDNFHRPHIPNRNKEYRDLDYKPLTNQRDNSLNLQGALADFRSIALAFHTEFFNTRFEDGLKGYDSPWLNKNLFEPWAMGEILGHILTQENMQEYLRTGICTANAPQLGLPSGIILSTTA